MVKYKLYNRCIIVVNQYNALVICFSTFIEYMLCWSLRSISLWSKTVSPLHPLRRLLLDGELSLSIHLSESSAVETGYQFSRASPSGAEGLYPRYRGAWSDYTGKHITHTHTRIRNHAEQIYMHAFDRCLYPMQLALHSRYLVDLTKSMFISHLTLK